MFLIINIVIWICGGQFTAKSLISICGLALILDSIILNQSLADNISQWPRSKSKISTGYARQLLGSNVKLNRPLTGASFKSGSAYTRSNRPLTENVELHDQPTDHPPNDHDYFGKPKIIHGIYTTEPLQRPGPVYAAGQPDAHTRIISGVYNVKDQGERNSGVGFRPQVTKGLSLGGTFNDDANVHCPNNCSPNQWMCPSSCKCISRHERCDSFQNCEDSEDEHRCELEHDMVHNIKAQCESSGNHVMCPKTYHCIVKDWLCDGDDDCGDYTDETNCGQNIDCTENQFKCGNGFCIPKAWKCDGENDCKDFTDEWNCTKIQCTSDHFQCEDGYCVSLSFKCDGEKDCSDGSDERHCETIMNTCPEGEFKCKGGLGGAGGPGGRCVLNRFRCDGDNDCGDWSDEENCPSNPTSCTPNEHKCNDGVCIPARWKCDGEQDCDGGEDEAECGNMGNHTVQCNAEEFSCNNGRCILSTWLCDGYPDCSRGEDEISCNLTCDPGQFLCPPKKNSSSLKICVHQKHICDGQNDCPMGEDEQYCPKPRLCPDDSKCEQMCVTTPSGQSECACRVGYLIHPNRKNCTDIDECEFHGTHLCSQKCINTVGSYRCDCESGYILRPDLRTCKALGGAMQLLVANRWDIRKITLSNNRYISLVKGLHNAIAVDYHYKKGLLFWSDVSTDVIKKSLINGTRVKDVVKWGLEQPGGIAVDWVHDLLFWTDSGTRRIEVSNYNGDYRTVIVSNDLDKPRAIVVHPGEAMVIWSDWGPNPKIECCYMDGSERKTIISKGVIWPNGLAIDYTAEKLYWADAKQHVIESANFDGSARVKIMSSHLPHPFAITIFEDTMFWTDWNSKSVSSANKLTGKGYKPVHENFHFPMDIHSYHPSRQPDYRDRCQVDSKGNRGGCSHLCLPNKRSNRCACPIGLVLRSDRLTCNQAPEKLVLVARRKDIRLRQVEEKAPQLNIDMIIPLDGLKHALAIDWCSETDLIYWTDVERMVINRAYLNGTSQESVINSNIISPAGLALDWITNKIYWSDLGTRRIEVASADGLIRTLLIWENLDKPRDIVVNPIDGIMFWSDWGSHPSIERASMDGSNREVLVTSNLQWPNGLAIDYDRQKLYFVDGGTKNIEFMNFDGSDRKTIISGLGHPFGLDINDNKVYWTDWDTRALHIADKTTGRNSKILIANTSDLMDVRVFHRSRVRVQNPCSYMNGGCSHLCLLNPKGRTCACPIGVRLLDGDTKCEESPENFLIFAHRLDIRQVSLDIDNLIDIVLPLPSISNVVSMDVDLREGFVFWSDTDKKVIMRAHLNGSHSHQIIGDTLGTVEGLVYDSVSKIVYWTDADRKTVECSDWEGHHRHLIAYKELQAPRGIALDYNAGFLFWTDWGHNPKIERADMDGGHRKKIVSTKLGWPNCLSLDMKAEKVFWTDSHHGHIESTDYYGNHRKVIISNLEHPYAITITYDRIYWSDWKTKSLQYVYRNVTSTKYEILADTGGIMDVKIIAKKQNLPDNECGNTNGGCSNLCLRNPKGYSCKCPIGLKLRGGSVRECETIPEDYLLIAERNGVGMISLNTEDNMDTMIPINGVQGAVVIDFHYNKSLLYIADVNLDIIRRINLANTRDTKTIVSNLATPNGLAVDWVADNLYWTDADLKVIEVSRLDGTSRKTLVDEYINDIRSLAIHPKKGFLFWSDWGEPKRLERSMLDGSNRSTIIVDIGLATGLTVDYQTNRLYWADALKDRLEMSDLNGKRRKIVIKLATHPFGVTLFENNIYWTDWFNKSVYRATNISDTFKQITQIRHSLSGSLDIRTASRTRQPAMWNQCAVGNGGCSHLCLFTGSSYVCACPDVPDDRECSIRPTFIVPPKNEPLESNEEMSASTEANFDVDTGEADTMTRTIIIISTVCMTVVLIIVLIVILVLLYGSSRAQKKKRHSNGSSQSVLTFSNPNYHLEAGAKDQKPTIWKRLKYDPNQERVYEERNLTVETPPSSLFEPSPSLCIEKKSNLPTIT